MIEIKCSKTQYDRIIKALVRHGQLYGKCVFGKDGYTCPSLNGRGEKTTCAECLHKNIVRKEDGKNENI